jgi:hypothetical protein
MLKKLTLAMLLLTATLARADDNSPSATEQARWVGSFDQCSFNALGAVLRYYQGTMPTFTDRQAFEKTTFQQPLNSTGLGAYYGWAPWTSYIVNTRKMPWGADTVTNIRGENFSLATAALPVVEGGKIRVTYAPGEREALREKLRAKLQEGPVVLWVPYAAAVAKINGITGNPWQHIHTSDQDPHVDFVPFAAEITHSVTVFARATGTPPSAEALVMDCSVRHGIYTTSIDALVTTAAAMRASIRVIDSSGSSVFSRGLKGITGEAYEVAFHQQAAPTAPTTQSTAGDPQEKAALALLPPTYTADVRRALAESGDHRAQWVQAINQVPPDQRTALAFLLAGMPATDLQHLDKAFILDDLRQSFAARNTSPWASEIPQELFLAAVVPYANLNEKREAWRATLAAAAAPLIAGTHTPSEAALALNAKLFTTLHVQYHPTKRPKPDQSPSESIAAGYASCTGLSILLVDACRSVNIPARVVGTPAWVIPRGDAHGNHAGNHTWVEIWDHRWHILGASEISPLDHTWFLDNARLAAGSTDPLHHIYAAMWANTGTHFPLVWAPEDVTVNAEDVTPRYGPQ